jgi:hypothetical protein
METIFPGTAKHIRIHPTGLVNSLQDLMPPQGFTPGATTLSADASHVLGAQDFFIHAQNASKSQQ